MNHLNTSWLYHDVAKSDIVYYVNGLSSAVTRVYLWYHEYLIVGQSVLLKYIKWWCNQTPARSDSTSGGIARALFINGALHQWVSVLISAQRAVQTASPVD
jgi:hypothetical protein